MVHRVAIYFTPPPADLLTAAAAAWLGRDPHGGAVDTATDPGPDDLVAAPRRYGFHATLKAPFRLANGDTLADVDAALAAFCDEAGPVVIPAIRLARLDRFFALVPSEAVPDLDDLAARTVELFDRHRAPLSEADLARREVAPLSERERANLMRWGYPYTHQDFRFHMTLTGPVADEESASVELLLATRFAPFIDRPLLIDGLALFVEPTDGADFMVHARHKLRGDAS
ncbi:MAG: DUF1045 domain-containing protein [Bauldia sp.]|nr:DUF1045 domain-containing protein [Bauldia sp.]